MMSSERLIAVDLFAGAGGLSLGFEQAGFEVALAVEIDPVHCAAHRSNFPRCKVLCKDISDVAGARLREYGGLDTKTIDVLVGGSPCQGFSVIGRHNLDDIRNKLIMHFSRIVLELRPRYFVFENVKGMLFEKHRALLDEFITAMEVGGYDIQMPLRILNAAEYGVPQDRSRLFILGALSELPLPDYPAPRTRRRMLSGGLASGNLELGPSVWDAIGDLPHLELYEELLARDWVCAELGAPSEYAKFMRGLVRQPHDRSENRAWDPGILTCSRRTHHSVESVKRFFATAPGSRERISKFHRLHPDGASCALRAGTGSDRGSHTSARPIHPLAPRCITVREAARLHSYPDWFRFNPTNWHGFRQVGNSVPPLLANAVAQQIELCARRI